MFMKIPTVKQSISTPTEWFICTPIENPFGAQLSMKQHRVALSLHWRFYQIRHINHATAQYITNVFRCLGTNTSEKNAWDALHRAKLNVRRLLIAYSRLFVFIMIVIVKLLFRFSRSRWHLFVVCMVSLCSRMLEQFAKLATASKQNTDTWELFLIFISVLSLIHGSGSRRDRHWHTDACEREFYRGYPSAAVDELRGLCHRTATNTGRVCMYCDGVSKPAI